MRAKLGGAVRLNEFVIPFTGLKVGRHTYDFDIGSAFFEVYPVRDVEGGQCEIHLELEKMNTMLVLNFSLQGKIQSSCYRCNDPIEVDVEGSLRTIVKFGEESFNETEEIMILAPHEHEIDVSHSIYEMLALSMPTRIVHDEENCNPDVIDELDEHSPNNDDLIDPRWEELKKLNKKR